ncbi:MAG: hypothetical protein Q9171_003004 [Xanthocarpia ochracea]
MSPLDLAQQSANGIDLDIDTMKFRAEDAAVQDNSDIRILVVVAVSANIETVSVTQDKGGQVDVGCTTIPCWLRPNVWALLALDLEGLVNLVVTVMDNVMGESPSTGTDMLEEDAMETKRGDAMDVLRALEYPWTFAIDLQSKLSRPE